MIEAEPNELMFANDSKDLYTAKLEARQQDMKNITNHPEKDVLATKLEQHQKELDEKLKSIQESFKEDIENEMEKIRKQAIKISNTVRETRNFQDVQNAFLSGESEKIDVDIARKEKQVSKKLGSSDNVVKDLHNRVLFLESTLKEKDEVIRKLTQQLIDAGLAS